VIPYLQAWGVGGVGEVAAGDDLAGLLLAGLAATGLELADGDVLAVSSKVVSKALGLTVAAPTRDGAIAEQTVRVVAERVTPRGVTRIVESRSGPVLAAAGVDNSNVAPGTVLVLPPDPDGAARALRSDLARRTRCTIGVLVTDTMGRPWRDGQVDAALGAAGLAVTDDLRGGTDGYGNPLEVTVRAVADELAALADLVKGKLDQRPAALVRGLGALVTSADGPGAAALLRTGPGDWFRYGHVEAVRAAVGVPPGTPGVPLVPLAPGAARERLARAVSVAQASPHWPVDARVAVVPEGVRIEVPPDAGTGALLSLGALAQRVIALASAEGVVAEASVYDAAPGSLLIRVPG
jgi:coenzyme F420-0:L-glutamate ligase/coenzyme F420-1:gamma-L-glutamate ligase